MLFAAPHESENGPTLTFRSVSSYVGCSGVERTRYAQRELFRM